ncbi:MAG: TetR family transcriptional regulator [Myxococcaceae bacterium]|jgi:AcrR family transcriptional regulator|nr:TetR family transcriptional regulator [Myxococcaceae bacterium]MCA3012188.1 TetR family transcriptional regulator [Myxococcaceae bacterium]
MAPRRSLPLGAFPKRHPGARARKQPSQARSQALVASLLEATARILVQDGWDGLTTNRVARKAGVSVGSLYQYFPDKEALVSALIETSADALTQRLVALGPHLADAPVEQVVAAIVETTLAVTREEAALHRSVLLQLPRIGALEFFERLNQRVADVLAEWIALRRRELDVEDPSLAAFVIVTALDAVTDHALLLRPELLDSARLARQLERLVRGCLGLAPRRRRR